MATLTPVLLLLLLSIITTRTTASAYIFEYSIQLQGPHQSNAACTKRDFRMILHGIEQVLDENCNEYLRYAGYTGFVDRMNIYIDDDKHFVVSGETFVLGPYHGDAECESCPQDDKDTLYFRRATDRLSKKEISAYVDNELLQEIAGVVQSRGSPDCAARAAEWKATFRWL